MAYNQRRMMNKSNVGDYEAELNQLRQTIQAAINAGLTDVAHVANSTAAKIPSNLAELESLLQKFGDQLADIGKNSRHRTTSDRAWRGSGAFASLPNPLMGKSGLATASSRVPNPR